MADTDQQDARNKKIRLIHMVSAVAVLAVAFPLALSGYLPLTYTKESDLRSLGQQYAFTFKWFVLHALWLLIAICLVGRSRYRTGAFPAIGELIASSAELTFISSCRAR